MLRAERADLMSKVEALTRLQNALETETAACQATVTSLQTQQRSLESLHAAELAAEKAKRPRFFESLGRHGISFSLGFLAGELKP
jgi:hypothetical protein